MRKTLIFGLVFILLAVAVTASNRAFFAFNNDYTDSWGSYNFISTDGSFSTDVLSDIVNNTYALDLERSSSDKLRMSDTVFLANDFSQFFCVKPETLGIKNDLWSAYKQLYYAGYITSSNTLEVTFNTGVARTVESTSTVSTSSYTCFLLTKSSSAGMKLYTVSGLEDSDATAGDIGAFTSRSNWLGAIESPAGTWSNYFDGKIDHFKIWNHVITDSGEINSLFACGETECPLPLFELKVHDEQNNLSINNFVVNFTNTTGTTMINTTNGSVYYPQNQTVNLTIFYIQNDEGWFYENRTNNSLSTDYDIYYIYTRPADALSPSVTINPNNAFTETNQSNIFQYGDVFPINITLNDNRDLFAFSFNITRASVSYYNLSNSSLNGTEYNFSRTLNMSSWAGGLYNITVMVSDSHTDKEIKDYDLKKEYKKLTYDTAEGNKIIIESVDNALVNSVKFKDRYNFEFDFADDTTKKRVFNVYSDKPIIYKQNSKYKAHFVVWNNGRGNWIDFENELGEQPKVKRINDYHYEVTFDKLSDVTFKSIGGLNVNIFNYTFFRGSHAFVEPIASSREDFDLEIRVYDHATIQSVTGGLYFNETLHSNVTTTDKGAYWEIKGLGINYPAGLYNYSFEVNVTQINGNVSVGNLSDTIQVLSFGLDNCSSYNITTMYINSWIEDFPLIPINTTVEIDAEIWLSDPSNSEAFNAELTGNSTYKLCLLRDDVTFYGDLYIRHTTDDGFTHRYYLYNHTFTNITTNVSLYNYNYTSGVSDLKITLREYFSYAYFSNLVTKFQRRYPTEGVWRTVQMDLSDDFGLVFFNIQEEDTDYRLSFYDTNNNLLKTTDKLKFICSAGVCEVTFLVTPSSVSESAETITATASYNNVTSMININWEDSEGGSNTVYLLVRKETTSGFTNICFQTQSGASGSYACNVSAYAGDIYVRVYGSSETYLSQWIKSRVSGLQNVIGRNEAVFWSAGLIIVIVATGVAHPIGALIGLVLGLIAVFLLDMVSFLTLTSLILTTIITILIGIKLRRT